MKVQNFKELLLKKAEGDPTLQTLVKYMDSELIAEKVLELLEKMSGNKEQQGLAANDAHQDFASSLDQDRDIPMIHDALGHHISRYKAAVKANRPGLSDRHARKIFDMMKLLNWSNNHSKGNLDFNHVDTRAWERHGKNNVYHDQNHPSVQDGSKLHGEFVSQTDGLNYKGKSFDWLQKAPHTSYQQDVRKGHNGKVHNQAYPFEEMTINGLYPHIEDIAPEDLKGYEEHEFDKHPIMAHFKEKSKNRDPEKFVQYKQEEQDFHDTYGDQFNDRHQELHSKDPEAYESRGKQKSDPVHDDVDEPLMAQKGEKHHHPGARKMVRPDYWRGSSSTEFKAKPAIKEKKSTGFDPSKFEQGAKGLKESGASPDLLASLGLGGDDDE